MAAGQAAFSVAADVAALDACGDELALLELDRGALHVRQLRGLLTMHAVGRSSGMELATLSHAALFLGCSENRAGRLLTEALGLGELPGGLEAVECGLLPVEQSSTVVELVAPLPFPTRLLVWARLQQRLTGLTSPLPPARLAELLRGWIIAADAADAIERRKQAEAGRNVDYRRRGDGLWDLTALGFTGPDLQAVASRIRDRSAPVGPEDERTADQRRFDAFKDLLLGRDPLPLHDPCPSPAAAAGGRAACGCWPGSPVPCGADLLVHLTDRTALGTSDEPAQLAGHGPTEPDLVQQLLLATPRLRPVWTDEHGVVVAVGDHVLIPERNNPVSVRQALLQLAALPPPPVRHPRHPLDHPPDPPERPAARVASEPDTPRRLLLPQRDEPAPDDAERLAETALSAPGAATADGAHPIGTPGPYRLPRRLRRLIDVRSPRCEWPGCGARAVRCDAEHDLAWPDGPTCACNLGPCCRRHHRVKQLGWTKTRHSNGVTWTSPGKGRSWLSLSQHQPPTPPIRPLPPLPVKTAFDELSPREQDELRWEHLDDPAGLGLRATDELPEPIDHLGEHLRTGDTRWTLDLDNPYLWQEPVDT